MRDRIFSARVCPRPSLPARWRIRPGVMRPMLPSAALLLLFAHRPRAQPLPTDDCTSAGLLSVSTSGDCGLETAGDPDFCQSPCFQVLGPYMDRCQDELPYYATFMLSNVINLIPGCEAAVASPDGPGEAAFLASLGCCIVHPLATRVLNCTSLADFGACDLTALPVICSQNTVPNGGTGEEMCHNPCVEGMMSCVDNPAWEQAVGAETVQSITQLSEQCSSGVFEPGEPGDGTCNLMNVGEYCNTGQDDLPIEERCTDACTLEALDCIDDPNMADNRDAIVQLQTMCSADNIQCVPMIQGMGDALGDACCPGDVRFLYAKERRVVAHHCHYLNCF